MEYRKDENWVRNQFLKVFDEKNFHITAKQGLIGTHERDIIILDFNNAVLLVLECKDWGLDLVNGIEATSKKWKLKYLGDKTNPQVQADEELTEVLKKLPEDHRHAITFMSGVVFSSIDSVEKDQSEVLKSLDPGGFVLWADQLGENLKKAYQRELDRVYVKRGWHTKKSLQGKRKLYDQILKRIDPKINIPRREIAEKESEIIKIERLMTRIQTGHHRVNGVVGSGKTTFLVHKLKELVNQYMDQSLSFIASEPKVLVLTMTRTCKSRVLHSCMDLMNEKEQSALKELVRFDTFANFLHKDFSLLTSQVGQNISLDSLEIKRKYDAVIVDEYQDFQLGWTPFLYRAVEHGAKDDGLFLLLFDPAQAKLDHLELLFKELDEKIKLSWVSREHYLKVCYRLPEKIGRFALAGYQHFNGVDPQVVTDEALSRIMTKSLKPEFHEKGGQIDLVPVACDKPDDEALEVVMFLQKMNQDKGCMWKDMALVIPPDWSGKTEYLDLFKKIQMIEPSIHYHYLDNRENAQSRGDNRDLFFQRGDTVTVATPVRFKGLEIPYVICMPSTVKYFLKSRTNGAFYQSVTRALDTVVLMGGEEDLKEFRNLLN